MKAFIQRISNVFNFRDKEIPVETIIRYIKKSFSYLPEAFGLKCSDSVNFLVFGSSPKFNYKVGPNRFEE